MRALVGVSLFVALIALYGVSYRLMIQGRQWRTSAETGISSPKEPFYYFGNNVLDTLFAPAHAIDKRLRPDEWKADPPLEMHPILSSGVEENPKLPEATTP